MIEKRKYCSDVIKNILTMNLWRNKEDNKDFENSPKCWICYNDYIDNEVKVRGHSHITGKYKGSVHRDSNINVELNHKIPVGFYNLRNYDSHLIMQELGKFNLRINAVPNGLEKYMSFSINSKFSFTGSLQFLSSPLDRLVKNLGKMISSISVKNLITTY